MPEDRRVPKPTWYDHLRVAWVLVCSIGALVPIVGAVLLGPILSPWMRAHLRKRLQDPPDPPVGLSEVDAAAWDGRTIFVVAGEPSGDRMAARIVEAMHRLAPGLRVTGYGGPALAEAGADLHRNLMAHAVIGAVAVARTLGFWWRLCAETLARFREERPDLCLTIDFPGLNVRVAGWARKSGIPAVHVVAPQLWAHQPWRIFRWRRAVDRILATFPFESGLFRKSGIATSYVGHPLFEAPLPAPRTPDVWPGGGATVVEIWPGSRHREIRHHAPMLARAARHVRARMPEVTFEVRLAERAHERNFREAAGPIDDLPFSFVTQPAPDGPPLLGALACSGTATAQLATDLVPMVAFYRVGYGVRALAWSALTSAWFLLPNLIAGREVVPENLYTSVKAGTKIADQFLDAVSTAQGWDARRQDLLVIRERLAVTDVAERAARAILAEHPAAGGRAD